MLAHTHMHGGGRLACLHAYERAGGACMGPAFRQACPLQAGVRACQQQHLRQGALRSSLPAQCAVRRRSEPCGSAWQRPGRARHAPRGPRQRPVTTHTHIHSVGALQAAVQLHARWPAPGARMAFLEDGDVGVKTHARDASDTGKSRKQSTMHALTHAQESKLHNSLMYQRWYSYCLHSPPALPSFKHNECCQLAPQHAP